MATTTKSKDETLETVFQRLHQLLLELLKGKTCFHIKSLDATLLEDIDAALTLGAKAFKNRDWA